MTTAKTTRTATAAEVRAHYRDRQHVCRISRDGRVEFRPDADWHPGASPAWLEGRWVSEYRVEEEDTADVGGRTRTHITVRLT